jgi:hypothetical protein
MKISKRTLRPGADQPNHDETTSRCRAVVVQKITDAKMRKIRIWLTAMGISSFVYIGIVAGYLYYTR